MAFITKFTSANTFEEAGKPNNLSKLLLRLRPWAIDLIISGIPDDLHLSVLLCLRIVGKHLFAGWERLITGTRHFLD